MGAVEADGMLSPLWDCDAAVTIANGVVSNVLKQTELRYASFTQNSVHIGPLRDAPSLNVKQLVDMLRSHGERVKGDKAILTARLLGAARRWRDRSAWAFVTAAVDAHTTEAEFLVAETSAKRWLEAARPYTDFIGQPSGSPLLLHDDVILSHAGDYGADTLRQEQRSVTTIRDMRAERLTGNLRIVCHPPAPNGLRNYVIAGDVPASMARQAPYTTLVALTATEKNVVIGLRKCLCFGDDDGRQCRSFHMCVHARVVLSLVQRHMPSKAGSTDGKRRWALRPAAPTAALCVKAAAIDSEGVSAQCHPQPPLSRWQAYASSAAPLRISRLIQVGQVQASGRKREAKRAKCEWSVAGDTMANDIQACEEGATTPSDSHQQE